MLIYFRTFVRVFLLFVGFSGITLPLHAQKLSYPQGYYQFPIMPGLPNSLAGGLGDLRTNHFHAGVDIRTQQKEGLSVYAAAEGYVYKVAVQRSGYGNVIYLRHPNGQTTLYGHLLTFSSKLAAYVREEQYKKQSFEIDLFPEPGQFTFRKGEVIALSGNTGGSAGPHLHFEIRDSKDSFLNPLFFGFKEIKDVAPPKFVNMAIRPMDINARVNGQFDRQVYTPVKQKDGSYRIGQTISATGLIGLDLAAYDQMTGTGFRYGLQCIEIKMDGREVFSYNMEIFPNAATRDYNNLIDYETEQNGGQRFLKCYVPDGNTFDLYKTDLLKGKLAISDTLIHEVKIRISDSYENFTELIFEIKGENAETELPVFDHEVNPEWVDTDVRENTLVVKAKNYRSPVPHATLFVQGKAVKVEPDFFEKEHAVFLTDLRKFMPDSVQIGKTVVNTYLRTQIFAGNKALYKGQNWSVEFKPTSLFDTLFVTGRQHLNFITINHKGIALKDGITISFVPEKVPENKEHVHVYKYVNGDYRFVGGVWNGDEIKFETRELGTFVAMQDTIPPRINLLEHSSTRIRGYISDATSGISHYRAKIGGEWVLMNFDSKRGYIWSEKIDVTKPFEGELELEVTDGAGNTTILQTELKEPVVKKVNSKRKHK